MDQPKSIKCLSKNNKIYYTYSLEKKARQSREYYKQTEIYNARKRRHTFFKNVENMRKPHQNSLSLYKPTQEELREIMNSNLEKHPENGSYIVDYFQRINERLSLIFPNRV